MTLEPKARRQKTTLVQNLGAAAQAEEAARIKAAGGDCAGLFTEQPGGLRGCSQLHDGAKGGGKQVRSLTFTCRRTLEDLRSHEGIPRRGVTASHLCLSQNIQTALLRTNQGGGKGRCSARQVTAAMTRTSGKAAAGQVVRLSIL